MHIKYIIIYHSKRKLNDLDYSISYKSIIKCRTVVHITFQVSQGSAATDLRWGKNFNKFLFRNSLFYIAVKKWRKSANICQSYHKNKRVPFLWPTV